MERRYIPKMKNLEGFGISFSYFNCWCGGETIPKWLHGEVLGIVCSLQIVDIMEKVFLNHGIWWLWE